MGVNVMQGNIKAARNFRKFSFGGNSYIWLISLTMFACSVMYYLPVIAAIAGWSTQTGIARLHNLAGIDFYGILFFVPVVYSAYTRGINSALIIAFICTLIVIPYAILIDPYPNVLFKPTAFAIILSAVGSVVAMLQKGDEQRRRSIKELKCLYDIGKASEESASAEAFLNSVVNLIPEAMTSPPATGIRITLGDKVFQSRTFTGSTSNLAEDLVVGGDVSGKLEIFYPKNSNHLKDRRHLSQTLAERIGGALHEIELGQYIETYYEQLEEMVEKRTKDLEAVQEKLIRSERLAAVGELASSVGHELRNPLNVIRNCVYLVHMGLADSNDEETKSTLKLMDKQIDISNRIVTDLLDFTRVKPPKLAFTDLNALVKESLSWIQIPQHVTVVNEMNGTPAQVNIDAEQIGRAFANIISNGVQAINGKGEMKINGGVDGDFAWISFTDTGCGIPPENLQKIFEPLFTTKPKGIGLGLAITRRLVEQNNGSIAVTSQVSKGSTFTIKLPLQKERKD